MKYVICKIIKEEDNIKHLPIGYVTQFRYVDNEEIPPDGFDILSEDEFIVKRNNNVNLLKSFNEVKIQEDEEQAVNSLNNLDVLKQNFELFLAWRQSQENNGYK